ncbi:cytosine deaminase [Candidatus Bathyarchaeota archaeon]|nr:MAG: cytosine deaminase [Candidatus Bathyarchaeota archaeon]
MKVFEKLQMFVGEELKLKKGYLAVEEGKIVEVGSGNFRGSAEKRIDGKKLLAFPGFVNAHVHVGDTIAKELGFGKNLENLVEPPNGLKYQILRKVDDEKLVFTIRSTLKDMLTSGITTFVDFREGGIKGVKLLKEALKNSKIHSIILGRPDFYMNKTSLEANIDSLPEEVLRETVKVLKLADGIGLSSPNEYTDRALEQISSLCKSKGLIAIHAAEHPNSNNISKTRTGFSEVFRAIRKLKADFVVHLNYASEEDLEEVRRNNVGVVVCPRSSSILGLGFPPIKKLLEKNVTVALGTDNVMINQPDMFREMDYVLSSVNMLEKNPSAIQPEEVFRMATINGAKILKMDGKTGSIEVGKNADIVFVDVTMDNLAFSHNLLVSLIRRGRPENIKLVMIEGEIVLDKVGLADG